MITMIFQKQFSIAAIILTCCLETVASAELIINGGFETQLNFGNGAVNPNGNGPGFSGMTGTQIPNWTIQPGHGATVHDTTIYPFITGNYSLNLDGEGFGGNNADMYQDFPSAPTAYTINYDYQGWTASPTTFTVSITDITTLTVVFTQISNWTPSLVHVNSVFQGTGNNLRLRVSQQNTGFNDNAFIVDNFSVTTVPEPGSMVLFAIGGTFAMGRTRRSLARTKR